MAISMAMKLLGWLTGSRVGRSVAIGLVALAALFYVLLRARSSGYEKRSAEQKQIVIEGLIQRIKTDESIKQMSASERATALRSWVRGQ
jgi:hypothetical protein